MSTPHQNPDRFFKDMLKKWEGEYQTHKEDKANWVGNQLIGTKYGVTPATYAEYFHVPLGLVHAKLIQHLSLQEAATIAIQAYYKDPGLDRLTWSPLLEAVTDAGYNTGTGTAIRGLQSLVQAKPDGYIGPKTQAKYTAYLNRMGHALACWGFYQWRVNFYAQIVSRTPEQTLFLKGWLARAAWYTPTNKPWWVTYWGLSNSYKK